MAVKYVGKQVAEAAGHETLEALLAASAGLHIVTPLGFLASLVWDIVSRLMDAKRADKKSAAAANKQAEDTIVQFDLFNAQADSALANQRMLIDLAARAIEDARTGSAIEAVDLWIRRQQAKLDAPRSMGDESWMNDLLAHWVLQHSSAPGQANDTTSEAAYDGAMGIERVESTVAKALPTLFVHQLRYGLLSNGFADTTACDAIDRGARDLMGKGGARAVMDACDGLELVVPHVADPAQFARVADEAAAGFLSVGHSVPDYEGSAKRGRVKTKMKLKLALDDGCVVLDNIAIECHCLEPDRTAFLEGVDTDAGRAGFDRVAWEWSP